MDEFMRIYNFPEHFWGKVSILSDDECWEWQAGLSDSGYGRISYLGKDDKSHRVSWMLTYGKIPNKLSVLHKCDNPPCVNPAHLFLGTQLDNMKDMTNKGRGNPYVGTGEENPRAKLKSHDVVRIRELYEAGNTLKSLANVYKVSSTQILSIVSRKAWKHLP